MLYFDEAGYSGPNLDNQEQPFFTLASANLSDEEISQIKFDIDYEKWGKELHFKSIYTNYAGRVMLEKVYSHPLLDKKHIKLAYANKRFCIYAQIVNILIETYYHNLGINIYRGAKNLLLANGLYCYAMLHPNKVLVNQLECRFVEMIRHPSVESVAEFYRTTDELRFDNETDKRFRDFLSEIPPTIYYIREVVNLPAFYLDLTIPLFSESMQHWHKETGEIFDVIFDSSEPFFANLSMLESLRDLDEKKTLVGYGENKHIYPFPVGSMKTAPSHTEFGIQIADVFAGGLNFLLTPRKDKYVDYKEELKKYKLFQSVEINIDMSDFEFIRKRMKDVEGIDPLDFLCKHGN